MKLNKLKKFVAIAASVLMCGQVLVAQMSMTASAASTELSLKPSDIPVSLKSITYGGGTSMDNHKWNGSGWSAGYTQSGIYGKKRSSITNGNTVTCGAFSTGMLRRFKIIGNIELSNKSITAAQLSQIMKLNVVSINDGRDDGGNREYAVSVTGSNGSFSITSSIISFGEKVRLSYRFTASKSTSIVMYNSAITTGDVGYTLVSTSYNGENVYASMPTKINGSKISWAQRTAVYMNSLADVTGIYHGTSYILFDDPLSDCANCHSSLISVDSKDQVVLYPSSYNAELGKAMLGSYMAWGEMHEVSHCYAFRGTEKTFEKAFNYDLDDVHTNVRGMTALQNVTSLRNLNVYMDWGTELVGGTYKNAIQNAYLKQNTVDHFRLANALAKYAVRYGWNILEDYFKANSDLTMSNADVYAAVSVAQSSNTGYGSQWIFNSEETYRLINGLRYLAKRANVNFTTFLKSNIGTSVFCDHIKNRTNNTATYAFYGQVAGDLNANGILTAADMTFMNGYLNNTRKLSPLGALNADINKDGFINQADKTLLQNMFA